MIGSADARRAALFKRLEALEHAGIPFRDALDRLDEPCMAPVREAIGRGASVGDAFAAAPDVTSFEARLIKAGEAAGKLPETFAKLAAIHEDRAGTKRRVAVELAYPVVLIHLAILLPPIKALVLESGRAYLKEIVPPLAVLYGALAVVVFGARHLGRAAPRALDALASSLPLIGSLRRARSLAASLGALTALYEAGIPMIQAVEAAAETSPSPAVGDIFRRVAGRLGAGDSPTAAFASERELPESVVAAVATGEQSGKLDELLAAARDGIEKEATAKRDIALRILPVVAFLAVAGLVVYKVVGFYAGYFQMIRDATK